MTMQGQAGKRPSIRSMVSFVLSAWHDPEARIFNLDLLLVLVAAALPWSTSIFSILMAIWLISLLLTMDLRRFVRFMGQPVCWLPVALFALALLGTLWSSAPWSERIHAANPVAKLFVLPLVLYHFERSRRGTWVLVSFLTSCVLLMAMSFLLFYEPSSTLKRAELMGSDYEPDSG